MKKAIVIGTGFGGLGAAARLAAHGYEVEVFEKRDKAGGRGYVYEIDGFKFDGGPTVITAPFMFDDIFTLAGRRREDYVTFKSLDPFYRIFNDQGRYFDYNDDHEFILSEIDKWNPADKDGYTRFVDSTKEIFDTGFALIDKPFLKFSDMLRVAPDLIRLQTYRSVYGYVSRYVQDDFLRQCFSFHPLLIGGNPFDTTSIYALIHYLEREWGIHYTMGGTGAIVQALVQLIEELGGRFHYNAEVDEILINGRRATGVRLKDGSEHQANHIVSNSDVAFTYENMIPERYHSRVNAIRIPRLRQSMSLFVIYFGTKRRYTNTQLTHHNIILGPRYEGLLSDIFRRKTLSKDFSLYLHMPTITDASIAPPGHEAFYVLSPVPNLAGDIDWTKTAKPYRDAIMSFLEENYLPDLEANIVAEHYIDPLHFQGTLNSHLGSAFAVEPILTQSAWFRPHNRADELENLYFVGAGTHPGAGVPGVLASSVIAQNLILQADGRQIAP